MRETNKSNAKTFGIRPLVVYRIKILRTLTGGLPEGKSDTNLSKTYTLYSDAFSSLPRAEDIVKMAEDLYTYDNLFFIDDENGFLSEFKEIFEGIDRCEQRVPEYYRQYIFQQIERVIQYDENIRNFHRFAFPYDEFANMLASRKEETYILSKTIKYNFYETFFDGVIISFLTNLQGFLPDQIRCHDLAKQRFEAWGGIEKFKTLLDLTLTTQIRVERISNPQKNTYGSEGGSMGKRRRE
jgi:hypothetical protein